MADASGIVAVDDRGDNPIIKVGDVVLAPDNACWFEAVVQEVKPDGGVDLKWRDWPDEPAFNVAQDLLTRLPADAASDPRWTDIKAGSVIVANSGPSEGWFEATVVELLPGTRVDLHWTNEPGDPMFFRSRDELTLLPVGYAAKAGKKA
jgi:uncharacterized protein YndB with AHSA1/START domain